MLIDDIKEMVRTFSFSPMIRSNLSAPRNLMGSDQPSSSQAEPTALLSNRYMSTYYLRVQELKNYEMTDLTEMIVGLFSDYIISYIKEEHSRIISLSDEVKDSEFYSDKINEVLAGLNYVEDLKLHLFEYIYYGGYSYSIHWDEKNREFKKKLLYNPTNLISSYSEDGIKSYLVQTKLSSIEEVSPGNIVMIGNPTMELFDNISKEFKNGNWGFDERKNDTLYRVKQYRACKPLYYSIIGKVKEYLLKDQLINILSIKDLIAPLVYSVGMDKNTDPATADNLVTNIENLINKYADVSVIIESNFDINSLLDQINNNIKLVTDYNQNIANMSSLDLIKVNDRINELRNDQDNIRNGILQSCGIPESLFNGD